MELARFNEKSACPKCGYKKVGAKYCSGSMASTDYCRSKMRHSLKEHLDRTCERCGYVWAQDVLERGPKLTDDV